MGKYLKLFKNHAQYETFIGGGGGTPFIKPNVSHCIGENHVHYNPFSWDEEYLTFDIVTEGTIVWKTTKSDNVKTISYSINNGEWTEITPSTTEVSFNVSVGDKVRFKGNNTAYGVSTSSYNTFDGSTASFNVQGNIMSLTNGDLFANATTFESDYVFVYLFKNASIINAKNLILPATTLADWCYQYMFSGCRSLTTSPELPATTLASSCYASMFEGCTSLTTSPELPAKTLASYCYYNMFNGCRSLTTAPELPATTLAQDCYWGMFNDCRSLTTAPELPATTLAQDCYWGMFSSCTSLVNAPTLPATTLATECYQYMFYGCISLVNAPTLPATTLASYCYNNMFEGCSSLNYIKAMFTTTPSTAYTNSWVKGVASSGTFVKNSAATWDVSGVSGVPTGWTIERATK